MVDTSDFKDERAMDFDLTIRARSHSTDSGYAVVDFDTETETLSDWVIAPRWENGREYHEYGRHPYWGPNDEKACEHMEAGHELFRLMSGGNLFLSPIQDTPMAILDIGTGTGSWAVEVADEYPSAYVEGIDLSPIQPRKVPTNLRFVVDDCEREFRFRRKFDLIHIRGLFGTIRDWRRLYRQCFDALQPGGYLEQSDISPIFFSADGFVVRHGWVGVWNQTLIEAYTVAGISYAVESVAGQAREAGFLTVRECWTSWPVRVHSQMRGILEHDFLISEYVDTGLEDWSLRLLTSMLDWTLQEVYLLCALLRNELRSSEVHAFQRLRTVVYQKI